MTRVNGHDLEKQNSRHHQVLSDDDEVSTLSASSASSSSLKRKRGTILHPRVAYPKTDISNLKTASKRISFIPSPTAVLNIGRDVDGDYHLSGVPANISIDKPETPSTTADGSFCGSSWHERMKRVKKNAKESCNINICDSRKVQDHYSCDRSEIDNDLNSQDVTWASRKVSPGSSSVGREEDKPCSRNAIARAKRLSRLSKFKNRQLSQQRKIGEANGKFILNKKDENDVKWQKSEILDMERNYGKRAKSCDMDTSLTRDPLKKKELSSIGPLCTPSQFSSTKSAKKTCNRPDKHCFKSIHRSFWSVPLQNFPTSQSSPSIGDFTTAAVTTATVNSTHKNVYPVSASSMVRNKILEIEKNNTTNSAWDDRCYQERLPNSNNTFQSCRCRQRISNAPYKIVTKVEQRSMGALQTKKRKELRDDGRTFDGPSLSTSRMPSLSQCTRMIEESIGKTDSEKSEGVQRISSDLSQQGRGIERDMIEPPSPPSPPELKRLVPTLRSSQNNTDTRLKCQTQDSSLLLKEILQGYVGRGETRSKLKEQSHTTPTEIKLDPCVSGEDVSICTAQSSCTSNTASEQKCSKLVMSHSDSTVESDENKNEHEKESNTFLLNNERENHFALCINSTKMETSPAPSGSCATTTFGTRSTSSSSSCSSGNDDNDSSIDEQSETSSFSSKRHASATLKTASTCTSDTSFLEIASDDEASSTNLSCPVKDQHFSSTSSGIVTPPTRKARLFLSSQNESAIENTKSQYDIKHDVSLRHIISNSLKSSSPSRLEVAKKTYKNQIETQQLSATELKENKQLHDEFIVPQIHVDKNGISKPFTEGMDIADKNRTHSLLNSYRKASYTCNTIIDNMDMDLTEDNCMIRDIRRVSPQYDRKLITKINYLQPKGGRGGEAIRKEGFHLTEIINKIVNKTSTRRAHVPHRCIDDKPGVRKLKYQEHTKHAKNRGGFQLGGKQVKKIIKKIRRRIPKHTFQSIYSDKETLLLSIVEDNKMEYGNPPQNLSDSESFFNASGFLSEKYAQRFITSSVDSELHCLMRPPQETYQNQNNLSNSRTNLRSPKHFNGACSEQDHSCHVNSIRPLHSVECRLLPVSYDDAISFDQEGIDLYETKEYRKALSYFINCIVMQRKVNLNSAIMGRILNNRGCAEYGVGDCKKALASFKESLSIFKAEADTNAIPDPNILFQESIALCNIGHIYLNERKFNAAIAIYDQCLDVQKMFLGLDHTFLEFTKNHFNFAKRQKSLEDCHKTTNRKYIPASGFALFGG